MQKYIFELVEDRNLIPNNVNFKTVKLLRVRGDDKREIKLYDSYPETFSIYRPQGGNCGPNGDGCKFLHSTINPTCINNSIRDCVSRGIVNLNQVKVKVVLDDKCEYQISLSCNNKNIILPKSLVLNKNLNLKNYYDKEIKLLPEDLFHTDQGNQDQHYIPRVMYGEREICKLNPGFLDYLRGSFAYTMVESDATFTNMFKYMTQGGEKRYVVIEEKEEENKLLIYIADENGKPVDISGNRVKDINNIYNHNFNVHLRLALFRHSNIKEVMPELEIDSSLGSDIRQLECLVNKTSTVKNCKRIGH